MTETIIVVEPQCVGEQHAQFNADYLNLIAKNSSDLLVISEEDHLNSLRIHMANCKYYVSCDKLPKKTLNRLRHFRSLMSVILSNKNGATSLIFLSSPGVYLLFIPIFLFFFQKISIVHHGLLENLLNKNYKTRTLFKAMFMVLTYFDNINNIIVGEHAKETIQECGLRSDKFHYIRMPFSLAPATEGKFKNKSIKIVTIGQQTFEKGFMNTLRVINCVQSSQVEVSILGFANQPVKLWLEQNRQSIKLNKDMISAQEMYDGISNADFVFFTYPAELYRLTSSAAYFEALRYDKQIFALRNNKFFEYEANLNPKLVLCENIDELCFKLKVCAENLLVNR